MRMSDWSSDVCSSDLIHLRQRDGLFERADIGGERLRNHRRLLENLLLHEVAVIALLDRRGGDARGRNFALDRIVFAIEYLRAIASDDDPVAFLQLGDLLRSRRKRTGLAAELGFAPIFVSWAINDDA